jgi:hypothetical protein
MNARPRRRRRRAPVRLLAALAAGLVLLAVGIAIGEALHDNPQPGLTVTTTKTIVP